MLSAIAVKKLVGIQSDFWGERVNLTIPIDVRQQVKGFGHLSTHPGKSAKVGTRINVKLHLPHKY